MERLGEAFPTLENISYFETSFPKSNDGVAQFVDYLMAIPLAILNAYVIIIMIAAIMFHRGSLNPGLIFLLNLAVSDLTHAILLSFSLTKFEVNLNQNFKKNLISGCIAPSL